MLCLRLINDSHARARCFTCIAFRIISLLLRLIKIHITIDALLYLSLAYLMHFYVVIFASFESLLLRLTKIHIAIEALISVPCILNALLRREYKDIRHLTNRTFLRNVQGTLSHVGAVVIVRQRPTRPTLN